MTQPVTGSSPATALTAALRRPRYEVLALAGTADLVEQHVPTAVTVTITVSARRGLEPTLALAETLARRGFRAVPHLAARLVTDERHLVDILHRVDEAGVRDVFVVAGDADQPVGTFGDSLAMLSCMERLRESGAAPGPEQVGVAGYPQGHPFVSAERLSRALLTKQTRADYVVSQLCFDPPAVSAWLADMRRTGVRLPIHIGIAGVVDQRRLLRIARRIGVAQSARFLHSHRHGWLRLLVPGAYRPERVLRPLAADLAQPGLGVAGLHVYTMGDIAATERWRRRALESLATDRRELP